MKVINSNQLAAPTRVSPKGKYAATRKDLSVALGSDPASMDLTKRHPFDVAIFSIPAGKALCPYHAHDNQWEFYHIISGRGIVRDASGETPVGPGDAFVFKPREAHQIRNDGDEDLVYYIIADNPLSDHCHYPDSNKWFVFTPERRVIRGEPVDYMDGEE